MSEFDYPASTAGDEESVGGDAATADDPVEDDEGEGEGEGSDDELASDGSGDDALSDSDSASESEFAAVAGIAGRGSMPGVRPLHILPAEARRTPAVLSEAETAQIIALLADYISRNGTTLPADETAQFAPSRFAFLAAKREIALGLAPFVVRREIARLPNGEVVCEEYRLAELSKPHL